MPGAFGHLIGAWLAGKALTKCGAKFGRFAWAALLAGAIIPDADLLIDWTNEFIHVHRTLTHSYVGMAVGGILALIGLFAVNKIRKVPQMSLSAVLLSLGMLTHIMLDLTISSSGLQVFWPDNAWITLNEPLNHLEGVPTYEELKSMLQMIIADTALGIAWLAYLFWKENLEFAR